MVVFCLSLLFILLCFCFLSRYLFLFVSLLCPSLATMSFAGYFPARFLLPAFPFFIWICSWFGLVWFRLSCDHSWIRSGSVNVIYNNNNNNNCSTNDSGYRSSIVGFYFVQRECDEIPRCVSSQGYELSSRAPLLLRPSIPCSCIHCLRETSLVLTPKALFSRYPVFRTQGLWSRAWS